MKTLAFILIIQLSAWQICLAQKDQNKKADRYFDKYEYAMAAALYEGILSRSPNDIHAMEKLAICYNKLNDPAHAEEWLSKICNTPDIDAKYYRMYGQVLAANNKYNESAQWYTKYNNVVSDQHIDKIINGYNAMEAFYKDSSFYSVSSSPLNSSQSDFSPAFYKDGILFCSARGNGKNDSRYAWNNTPYIDLFYSVDGVSLPQNFGKPVNTSMHEGPAVFTSHYDTLYFTRNNSTGKSDDGVVKLKMYYSVFKDGKWQKEQSFGLNNENYSVGHPALSPDHKLYFVSDMPGGVGGTDIYYATFTNGHWSKPTNAGTEINTSGNEMFPSFDEDGNLYFSSNTHPGLGGLDIFVAKKNGNQFLAPVNLGYPINSSQDDFGLIIKNNKGYFSSNRGNNPMNDNLFSFTIGKTKSLSIRVTDKDGTPLNTFNINISGDTQKLNEVADSIYKQVFNCEENYVVSASKAGYLKKEIKLSSNDLRQFPKNKILTIVLDKALKPIVIQLQSPDGKTLADGEIQIHNLRTNETSKYQTDKNGNIAITLDQESSYEITGLKPNYKTKSINIPQDDVMKITDGQNLVISLPLATALFDKNEVGQMIELDIKYDKAKWNIRPDAAKELDKLVSFLKKNPTVKVELGSHTDVRGSNESNLVLSQKRAESCVRYIVSKGVSSKLLIPIGYGEDDLKVKDAVTEEDHQQNRRTTVKIVGI